MDDKNQQKPQPNMSPEAPKQPDQLPEVTPDTSAPMPKQEVEPSTTPVPPSMFNSGTPAPAPTVIAGKPKNKKRIMIIIIAVVVVLLGAAAAAYQFWYQNPQKVVTDGLVHALQAETTAYTGTIDVNSEAVNVKIAVDGAYDMGAQDVNAKITMSLGNIDYTLTGSVLFDKNNDLYIKIANLDAIIAPLRLTMPEEARATFDGLVAKVDNTWIKISADELATYNQGLSRSQTCLNNAVQQTENHVALQKEIKNIYTNNAFVTAAESLGSKDGSMGYSLTIDQDKAKAFAADLKNTESYKTLHDCDETFTIDENSFFKSQDASGAVTTQLWVSQFTHQITEFSAVQTNSDKTSTTQLNLKPVYNTAVSINSPEQSITLKELQDELTALQQVLAQQAQQSDMNLSSDL
jgi:hypothetical protein